MFDNIVQRYTAGKQVLDPQGSVVLYRDYERLAARVEVLEKALMKIVHSGRAGVIATKALWGIL